MGTLVYPLINGQRYSFASVEATLPGMPPFTLFKGISYTQKLEPGKVKGNSPVVQGFTIGDLEATGNIELYEEEDSVLVAGLGAGFLTIQFDIVINFSSTPFGLTTDTIVGARFTSGEKSMTQSTDGITVKREIVALKILENGIDPLPAGVQGNSF